MDDTISRKAAIDAMAELQGRASSKAELKGISKAWKMIKQLPPARPEQLSTNLAEVGTDCISRQVAITAIDNCGCDGEDSCGQPWIYKENAVEAIEMVEPLPPVQPERIKGHWIKISPANIYECSECGKSVMTNDICAYDFCHGCGADMREVTT